MIFSKKLLLIFSGLFLTYLSAQAASPGAPTNARLVDHFEQLGIDTQTPRFGWEVNDTDRSERQSAYQVVVSSSQEGLSSNTGILWDSGKMASAQQFGVAYAGSVLAPASRYWWRVRTWDKDDQASPWSAAQSFVTGFFQLTDWNAGTKWIRLPSATGTGVTNNPPAIFRKEFQVNKPVKQAFLYLTGLGQFVASLNGTKVGNHELDPDWTDYDKTVVYVTFDVTSQLQQGANALGVMLGNGWACYSGTREFGPMKTRGQLHIEYTDGTTADVVTDSSWKTTTSPFTSTEVHGAETFDARLEQAGWKSPGFDDSAWPAAVEATAPAGTLAAQSAPPTVVRQVYSPIAVTNPATNVYVYDFGQNMHGQYEITVSGAAGATVTMLAGERLSGGRPLSPGNNTNRTGYSNYTLRGGGTETWKLTFSGTGFRYLQVSGVTTNSQNTSLPYLQSVKAYRISSGSSDVGSLSTSDTRYNRIYDLARYTLENTHCSIHMDGPNFERLGWQEVVWTVAPSMAYQHDQHAFLAKVMRDVRNAQRTGGLCPDIAPNWFSTTTTPPGDKYDDSPAWGSAVFIACWDAYKIYGDVKILQDNYATMVKYLAYLKTKESNGLVTYGLGDWMAPGGSPVANVEGAVYVHDTALMRDIATVLGKTADATFYASEFTRVRNAYNTAYFNPTSQSYQPMNQANQAIPLVFGIVPDASVSAVQQALVNDIIAPQENGTPVSYGSVGDFGSVLPYHLTTGDVATTPLWRALGDAGESDLVQTMVMQSTAPSYMAILNNGDTTITENWNLAKARSHDHDMYAGIFEWMYRNLGGISALQPGYAQIQLKPQFPAGLASATASYRSIRGVISSALNASAATWNVTVPPNSMALIYVPTSSQARITEGGTPIWQNGVAVPGASPGLVFDHTEPGYVVWNAGSGTFQFAWEISPTLTTTAQSGSVKLDWTDSSATAFSVKRGTTAGGPYTTIASGLTGATYTDSAVSNGTTYFYVVSAQHTSGNVLDSGEASATPFSTITVANFDFETPSMGTGATAYQYNPTGGSWTFTAKGTNLGSGISANSTDFTKANSAAPQGIQVAFLQGTATISQTILGFTSGKTYTVKFSAAERGVTNSAGQGWRVRRDSTTLATFTPGASATSYVDYSVTFTATATSHSLSFVGTSTSDNTVFIDNVRITPAPPSAPTGLGATVASSSSINLSWTAATGAAAYKIKRAVVSGGPFTLVAANVVGTSYADTGLSAGATYYYVVSATSADGESADFSQASATTLTALEQWRLTNFGSTANTGNGADSADPDGDGWANAQEFTSGTDPNDRNSALKITQVELSGGDMHVSFPTVSGKTYALEYSGTLAGSSWAMVLTNGIPQNGIQGTGSAVQVTDTGGAAAPKRFYRVLVY